MGNTDTIIEVGCRHVSVWPFRSGMQIALYIDIHGSNALVPIEDQFLKKFQEAGMTQPDARLSSNQLRFIEKTMPSRVTVVRQPSDNWHRYRLTEQCVNDWFIRISKA